MLTVSDDLTCFRCPPKFGVTAAEAEILPKVSRSLSAEIENMPKVLKSTLSAPKPKPKPKFGRTLVYLFIRVVLRVSCCDVMHIVEFCLRRNKVDYYIIIKEILTNVERRTIVWLEIALPVAGDDDDDESTITKTGVGKNS